MNRLTGEEILLSFSFLCTSTVLVYMNTKQDALPREVKEEPGIDVEIRGFFGLYKILRKLL